MGGIIYPRAGDRRYCYSTSKVGTLIQIDLTRPAEHRRPADRMHVPEPRKGMKSVKRSRRHLPLSPLPRRSFVLKTRRTDNKACREAGSPKRRMRCAPIRVTRSTHVCHQEHTPLWRYAQRWWRWQRAGLDGRVSLKGGLKRVVIRQLRLLGIVGFPIPKHDAQTGTWKMRASSASG